MRGEIGAGSNRMNLIYDSQGICWIAAYIEGEWGRSQKTRCGHCL